MQRLSARDAVESSQLNMPSGGSQCYLTVCTRLVPCEAELKLPGPNLSFSLPEANFSGLMQSCAFHWVPARVFVN